MSLPLLQGLLKIWPITNPAKEVIFLNEIEELLEQHQTFLFSKFNEFGPKFLKRVAKTSQSMHYQAAERSLLLLNSEIILKLVKQNKQSAYTLVVKSLINGSQQSHWNQTVITITYTVIRAYMEMDPELFERLTNQAQSEEKTKMARGRENESKWAKLERIASRK